MKSVSTVCKRRPAALLPSRKSHPRSDGFSIVEVAIAMTILALAIATSLAVMSQGFRAMDTARSVRVATQIIQDEMENIRMTTWTTVQSWATGTPGTQLAINAAYTANPYIGNRFNCRRIVEDVAGKANMRSVTLSVSWQGSDGLSHERSAKTYYTQAGLFSYVSN